LIQGYASGALILTFFEAIWALLTMFGTTPRQRIILVVVVLLVTIPLAYSAIMVLREARQLPSVSSPEGEARGTNMAIGYGVVFASEFILIAVASILLSRVKRDELIPLVTALIVGLHFLPLAAIFHVPVYYVTGVAITVLAIVALLGMFLGRTLGGPWAWAVVVGLGNAVILWLSAFYVLSVGRQLLNA
jgi:hypothetical protein